MLSDGKIQINYIKGPLEHLHNVWCFEDRDEGGCKLHFEVDFEFKNKIFQKMVGGLFTEAVRRMVSSFELRAKEIYKNKD